MFFLYFPCENVHFFFFSSLQTPNDFPATNSLYLFLSLSFYLSFIESHNHRMLPCIFVVARDRANEGSPGLMQEIKKKPKYFILLSGQKWRLLFVWDGQWRRGRWRKRRGGRSSKKICIPGTVFLHMLCLLQRYEHANLNLLAYTVVTFLQCKNDTGDGFSFTCTCSMFFFKKNKASYPELYFSDVALETSE